MKNFLLSFVCFFMASQANSDDGFLRLNKVDGFIVHSSASVSNLTLNEGRVSGCTAVASGFGVTRCDLEGATLTLTPAVGDPLTLPVSQLSYYQSASAGEIYHHYIYKMVWRINQNGAVIEEPAALTLLYKGLHAPTSVRGYFSMSDLDVSEQVRGTVL